MTPACAGRAQRQLRNEPDVDTVWCGGARAQCRESEAVSEAPEQKTAKRLPRKWTYHPTSNSTSTPGTRAGGFERGFPFDFGVSTNPHAPSVCRTQVMGLCLKRILWSGGGHLHKIL